MRAVLVEAGHRVLQSEGASGLTVRAVAAEAGVAPMGVYNHFDGKAGLLSALATDGFINLREHLARGSEREPIARVRRAGVEYRRLALESPHLYRLMFSSNHPFDEQIADSARRVLTELVVSAQGAGAIREGDAFELTMSIWSVVHGVVSLELDASPLDGQHRWSDIFEHTLDLMLNGMKAEGR